MPSVLIPVIAKDFTPLQGMFAPSYGIDEAAATGMAAGPLASYLYDQARFEESELSVLPGVHMPQPSPSRLSIKLVLKSGQIQKLYAGGDAYRVKSEEVNY